MVTNDKMNNKKDHENQSVCLLNTTKGYQTVRILIEKPERLWKQGKYYDTFKAKSKGGFLSKKYRDISTILDNADIYDELDISKSRDDTVFPRKFDNVLNNTREENLL